MAGKSHALQTASGASVARLEETQEAYKSSVVALQERLEASVREINRGNAIIQKLQGQYRALRSKTKLKSEVIKQQVAWLLCWLAHRLVLGRTLLLRPRYCSLLRYDDVYLSVWFLVLVLSRALLSQATYFSFFGLAFSRVQMYLTPLCRRQEDHI